MAVVMILMCLFMVVGAPHGHIDAHNAPAHAEAQHVEVLP